jgi:hypothetical protein
VTLFGSMVAVCGTKSNFPLSSTLPGNRRNVRLLSCPTRKIQSETYQKHPSNKLHTHRAAPV